MPQRVTKYYTYKAMNRTQLVGTWMSDREKQAIEAAARQEGRTVSSFVRHVLTQVVGTDKIRTDAARAPELVSDS